MCALIVQGEDLGTWAEDEGWEAEEGDWEEEVREQRKLQREKRALELRSKRAEHRSGLGARMTSWPSDCASRQYYGLYQCEWCSSFRNLCGFQRRTLLGVKKTSPINKHVTDRNIKLGKLREQKLVCRINSLFVMCVMYKGWNVSFISLSDFHK